VDADRAPVTETPETPGAVTEVSEGLEPQAKLEVRGALSKVRRQLGDRASVPDQPTKEKESKESLREALVEALRNPKNRYVVKRQTPKKQDGIDIARTVMQDDCPITFAELEEEVFSTHGGKRYRVSVHDRDTGNTVAADTMERDTPPILEELEDQPDQSLMFEPSEPQKNLQQIEDLTKTVNAQARLEEAKRALAEIRGDPKTSGRNMPVDPRVDQLEKTIARLEAERREEIREERHQRELSELKAQIAASNAKPASGQSEIHLILQQMEKQREQSQQQFNMLVKQMQDDRMTALQASIDRIGNKDPMTSMKGMVDTFATLASAFGVKLPHLKDEDDDDDEPKEWWQVLMEKAPDFIDMLMKRFSDQKGSGPPIDREAFMRKMAQEAEDEAVARGLSRVNQGQRALPAPVKTVTKPNPLTSPPPPNTAVLPPTKPADAKVPALPPPPPGTPGAPPDLKLVPPVSTEQPAQVPTDAQGTELTEVEKQVLGRIISVMDLFMTELEIRPRIPEWTYEAWTTIPEDMLEKICACETGDAFIDVIATNKSMKPEGIKIIRDKVNASQRTQEWVKRGLDELKRWWEKAQKDPDFDPDDEEEEEEEETA
jgi:hypothetical protein